MDNTGYDDTTLIFDSGASYSVVSNKNLLTDFSEKELVTFMLPNGEKVVSQGTGQYLIKVGSDLLLNIHKVFYIANLHVNLLSLADITSKSVNIIFTDDNLKIQKDDKEYVIATRDPNTRLYIGYDNGGYINLAKVNSIDCDKNQVTEIKSGIFSVKELVDLGFSQYIVNSNDKKDFFYYHLLTNHMSLRALDQLIDHGKISASKKDLEARKKVQECVHCKAVNSKRVSHNRSSQRAATRRLQRLHLDTLGPVRVNGLKFYITTLIDEFSGFMICVILDTRSVQLSIIRELKIMNNLFPGESVANLRCDNARELPDRELLLDLGIRKEEIPAYTPAMNGRAESYNKKILKQIKLLLLNFPHRQFHLLALFTELVSYCVYTINHTPSNRVPDRLGESPYEIFYGHKYTVNFRQFGTDVLVHINNPIEASSLGVQLHKAVPAVVKGFMVGYGQDSNSYFIKVMHGNNPIKLFANVTFLNSMNYIEEFFKLLDEQQLAETRDMADTLTRLDELADRNSNFGNSNGGRSPDAFPNPESIDVPSFKDIFYGNLGVSTINDLFDLNSNSVLGVHETESRLHSNNNSLGATSCYTMSVKLPGRFTKLNSGQRWSRKSLGVSSGLEPVSFSASGLSESASKDKIPNPNGGERNTRLSMSSKNSSTLKFDLSEGIESAKLELGYGGHTLVSESLRLEGKETAEPKLGYGGHALVPELLRPDPVDVGQFGLPVRKKKVPKRSAEVAKELAKTSRVINKLDKLIGSHNSNSDNYLNSLDSESSYSGLTNSNRGYINLSRALIQGRISDIPQLVQNSFANEIVPPKQKVLFEPEVTDEDGIPHAIYSVERHVDMTDENWIKAMKKEMDKFREMDVFDVVPIPERDKVIPAKWVHTYKVDSQKGDNYKLRCVIQGFKQLAGVNFDPSRVSSPVTDLMSIRVLTVIAVEHHLEIHHVDIKSAYLNSSLPRGTNIYVRPPPGVDIEPGKCWRLKKAVYGLKQAAFEWFIHISKKFEEMDINSCDGYEGVFIKKIGLDVIYIALYVDDLFIVSSSNQVFNEFLRALEGEFKLNYLGPVSEYLGVEFTRTDNGYKLSQRKFMNSILDAFELHDGKAKSLPRPPMDSNRFQAKAEREQDHLQVETQERVLEGNDIKVYQRGVGMLQWLCLNTRPDIAFATNALGIKASAPTEEDYKMLIHCIKYLKGTLDYGLQYISGNTKLYGEEFLLHGFADASYAPPDSRKSVSGFAIYLNGNLVSWGSKKQRCITQSSMSSEIQALGEATLRIFAVRDLLRSLGLSYRKPILLEDNMPAIKVAHNKRISYSRRSIDIVMKYIRDLVLVHNKLGISYISTTHNIADIMTKAAGVDTFNRLRPALMSDGKLSELGEELMTHFIGGNNPNIGFMKFCEVVNKEILICNRESNNPRMNQLRLLE